VIVMNEFKKAKILDCTIRDGSYVVDYQFTIEDTFIVARGLFASGIRHIEVGHGLGLNAQNVGKGNAAISDTDYISSARAAVGDQGFIGSFFIPGIGTEDSIRAAKDAGLGFIRLGIDVDDFAKLEPFVRLAKSLGLEVWGNMMKSYIVPPGEFGDIARRVSEFGVDVVALVDSAGGMTPDDVAKYTDACVTRLSIPLAFHGHNNLTLAVANCLRFVKAGGIYVDGSLAGLGRSGGNASTELLAAILGSQGLLAESVEWENLIEFADAVMAFIVPFHSRPRSAEIATGLNYFHSSFGPLVEDASFTEGAQLFRTILRLPHASRKKVSKDVALTAARAAAAEKAGSHKMTDNAPRLQAVERYHPNSLPSLAECLRVLKGKSPQRRIVTVALSSGLINPRIGPLRSTHAALVAHVEVSNVDMVRHVMSVLSESCDIWMLDMALSWKHDPDIKKPIFIYDDNAVIVCAIADALQVRQASTIAVESTTDLADKLSKAANVIVNNQADRLDAIVIDDDGSCGNLSSFVQRIRAEGFILMVRAGKSMSGVVDVADHYGVHVWRLDCGPALVAEAERVLNTYDRFVQAAGEKNVALDVRVVAGGIVGRRGDLVVDHINRPRYILGVADGCGGVLPTGPESSDRVRLVQKWIESIWGI